MMGLGDRLIVSFLIAWRLTMSMYNTGNDIVKKLNLYATSEFLREYYYERTKEWKLSMISIECGTIGTFSDLKLSPLQSFNLISTAVLICLEQNEKDLFTTALSLLLQIIKMSETTELPMLLSDKWDELNEKVNYFKDRSGELYWQLTKEWYRVNA